MSDARRLTVRSRWRLLRTQAESGTSPGTKINGSNTGRMSTSNSAAVDAVSQAVGAPYRPPRLSDSMPPRYRATMDNDKDSLRMTASQLETPPVRVSVAAAPPLTSAQVRWRDTAPTW